MSFWLCIKQHKGNGQQKGNGQRYKQCIHDVTSVDHTARQMLDPIWTPKLRSARPGEYLAGGPPGKLEESTYFNLILFSDWPKELFRGFSLQQRFPISDFHMTFRFLTFIWHSDFWLSYDIPIFDFHMTFRFLPFIWHSDFWLSYDIPISDFHMTFRFLPFIWHSDFWLSHSTPHGALPSFGRDLVAFRSLLISIFRDRQDNMTFRFLVSINALKFLRIPQQIVRQSLLSCLQNLETFQSSFSHASIRRAI